MGRSFSTFGNDFVINNVVLLYCRSEWNGIGGPSCSSSSAASSCEPTNRSNNHNHISKQWFISVTSDFLRRPHNIEINLLPNDSALPVSIPLKEDRAQNVSAGRKRGCRRRVAGWFTRWRAGEPAARQRWMAWERITRSCSLVVHEGWQRLTHPTMTFWNS